MFEPSKETRVLLATFMAVSAGVVAGCSDENEYEESESSYERLKDDNGKEYTLVKNADGTETAKYDNGESVTFKRDDDGNLAFVAGAAGLLAGVAAGYYMWHGLNPSGGYYDSNTKSYKPSSEVSRQIKSNGWSKYDKEKDKGGRSGGSTYTRSNSTNGGGSTGNSTTSNSKPSNSSEAKSTTPSNKSSVSAGSTKSGFGSAGARSGGAAS